MSLSASALPEPVVSGDTRPFRNPQPVRLLIENVPASVPPKPTLNAPWLFSAIADGFFAWQFAPPASCRPSKVTDGTVIRLLGDTVYVGDEVVAKGRVQTAQTVAEAMTAAKDGIAAQLQDFVTNTLEYVKGEGGLLVDGIAAPDLRTKIEGRHVLVVVRGNRFREDLTVLRPYIREFNSSGYIDEMASGDLCMVYGYSGDVMIARHRATEAKKPYDINYFIPKGGAPAWFDVMAVPKDAPHPENAMAFVNYIETPQVHAAITNTMFYPNANKEARKYVVKEVADNPEIYPSPEVAKTLFVIKALPLSILRLQTRLWAELKSGR